MVSNHDGPCNYIDIEINRHHRNNAFNIENRFDLTAMIFFQAQQDYIMYKNAYYSFVC